MGLGLGEITRVIETKRLQQEVKDQTALITSLVSGLTVEAIITEDTPLVETALKEAVLRIPYLEVLRVENERGG